jgi:hypothetical protein
MPTLEPSTVPSTDARPTETMHGAPRRQKILAAAIYLSTAAGLICCFRFGYGWFNADWFQNGWYEGSWFEAPWLNDLRDPYVIAALLAAVIFLFASVRVFPTPKSGYIMGLIAALPAWPFFLRNELRDYRLFNSWVALNLSDQEARGLPSARLTILAVVLLLIATLYSLLRLAPTRWRIGRLPLRDRTWPAFVISFVVVAAWYLTAVTLYRPFYPGGMYPRLRVVHVGKHGLQFRETTLAVMKDRRFYVVHSDRILFQYSFEVVGSMGLVPEEAYRRLKVLIDSPQFRSSGEYERSRLPRYPPLRVWNSDRWFVYFEGVPSTDLFNVDQSAVPKELLDWFYEAQNLPTAHTWRRTQKDVCLGFCYDPTY